MIRRLFRRLRRPPRPASGLHVWGEGVIATIPSGTVIESVTIGHGASLRIREDKSKPPPSVGTFTVLPGAGDIGSDFGNTRSHVPDHAYQSLRRPEAP